MPREDISFQSYDHVTLRGWFYTPENATLNLPCLILSHGYTCLKEMSLDTIAAHLVSTLPLTCLVYDHRGFGTSDTAPNMPRCEIIPSQQCSDLQDAITYAQMREEVDASKIGVWGYSFSGGHVLSVSAVDKRVKAVVALAPFVDGKVIQRNVRPDMTAGLHAALHQDRVDRAKGKEPGMLPVVVENPLDLAALPQKESYDYFTTKATEGWRNELTIRTLEETAACFPTARIHDIAPTPLLMIVPTEDVATITDLMLEAYGRAREPKELCLIGGGHFGVFEGSVYEEWLGKGVEFLRKNLCGERDV